MNTTHQLSKVSKSLKTVKDNAVRERLLMLKYYYQYGSVWKAGKQCGCSHAKVKYWKDRYEQSGLRGLYTIKQSGRPPSVSPTKMNTIRRAVEEKCKKESWSVGQVREYIKKRGGKQYTVRHTSRIIHSWGLAMITPRPQYAHAASKTKQRAFLKEEYR